MRKEDRVLGPFTGSEATFFGSSMNSIGADWLLRARSSGMKAPSRLFLAQLTPFTLLCLVALEACVLDDFLLVWLLAWSVKWYEVVPLALFGLPHGNRSGHQGMVLVRLPHFSGKQARQKIYLP